jgi:hypothetical protein
MTIQYDNTNNSISVVGTETNLPVNIQTKGTGGLNLLGSGTNLFLYSQDFTNASWSKSNLTVTAGFVAPNGTSTANKLVENNLTGQHLISQFQNSPSGITYTYSVYAKAAEWTSFQIQIGAGGPLATFNLSAVTASPTGGISASIISVGDGWFRCSLVGVSNGNGSYYIYKNSTSYAGNNIDGIFVWGAQLELGSVTNTYIPTTTTSIYGTPQLTFSGVASVGLQSNGNLNISSAGTGAVTLSMNTGTLTTSYDPVGNQTFITGTGNLNIAATAGGVQRFLTRGTLAQQFQITDVGSSVNFLQVAGAVTNGNPTISAQGSDTNVPILLQTKGTGAVNLAPGSSGVNISNGGTVTAITRTLTGGLYTSFPAIALSAPTAAGGVQATASVAFMQPQAATIGNGGTGYTVGDVLTVVGGTPSSIAATFTVTSVSGGVITVAASTNFATYSVLPTNPVSVTGGTGSGATLNITYGLSGNPGSFTITNAGSGYVEQPTLTFSGGGGGSGAGAFASVGGTPVVRSLGNILSFNTSAGEALRLRDSSGTATDFVFAVSSPFGRPVIGAQTASGSGNVSLGITSQGTAALQLYTSNTGAEQMRVAHTASAVNYVQATGAATGAAVQISAQGSDTNIPLALQPKGTGALQAQRTDSTATGGNARGANAVDWQTLRAAATQVASGQLSSILSGASNSASGVYSTIISGNQHVASGSYSSISGGLANAITSSGVNSFGFVGGGYGNTSSGAFNFIGAGYSNSGTSATAVTTQSATMNGTTAVTLSASNAAIRVGQLVSGTSINSFPNTYVAAISGTSLTLSQVASGSSTSTLSFFTPHGVVVGGGNNQATGSYSFIGGGGDAGTAANRNVASGDWSFVGGGQNNQATGIGAVVAGGGTSTGSASGNIASGAASTICGGANSTASGIGAFIGGGLTHLASGAYSSVIAGRNGTARAIQGNMVFPACTSPIANTSGTSQSALLVLGVETTDATATALRSNSAAAATTNQVILPNNSAYFFTGEVVSGVTGGGNTKGWTIEGVIKRGANAASTTLVGTPTVTSSFADAGASTWTIAVTADTTNGGLQVTFTGQAATTIRTVAQIRTTEMTY